MPNPTLGELFTQVMQKKYEKPSDGIPKTDLATNAQSPAPAAPVADGTYNLQVSVASGTATYSWTTAPGSASGVSF